MFLEKEAYWVTIRVLLSSPCHKSHRLWIPLTISQLNCDLPILINKPFFSSPPKKLETSKELLPLALALSSTNWDIKADGKSRLCLYNPWALTFPFRPFSNREITFCQHRSPCEVSAIHSSITVYVKHGTAAAFHPEGAVPWGQVECSWVYFVQTDIPSHPSSKPKTWCCYEVWRVFYHLHKCWQVNLTLTGKFGTANCQGWRWYCCKR